GGECCIVFAASVRSPRVPTRSFTLIPVPSTVGVPCSFWTLACLAASSTLHSLFGIPVRQASALPRASFRPTPHGGALASGCILPTAGRIRDFHPLERAPAGRTKREKAAGCKSRLLSPFFIPRYIPSYGEKNRFLPESGIYHFCLNLLEF
ncbi:hypothetical protein SAMN04487771_10867, partial [[Clostridium] aminophilum]